MYLNWPYIKVVFVILTLESLILYFFININILLQISSFYICGTWPKTIICSLFFFRFIAIMFCAINRGLIRSYNRFWALFVDYHYISFKFIMIKRKSCDLGQILGINEILKKYIHERPPSLSFLFFTNE